MQSMLAHVQTHPAGSGPVLHDQSNLQSRRHTEVQHAIEHVFVMKGGMGKKRHRQLIDRIASIPADRTREILSTGRYLGKGFDDERLGTLFLAMAITWRGTLTQHAGRLPRLNAAKKEVIIYDYVDFEVPVLAKMHARRKKETLLLQFLAGF